jgi:enoyl-CoA hydratase/carnithine racemase
LLCACDIRYCAANTKFCVKEVDVGLAADVGTLQRLPKIVGNDSTVRELAFTARMFSAEEAEKMGLMGKIFADQASMDEVCYPPAGSQQAHEEHQQHGHEHTQHQQQHEQLCCEEVGGWLALHRRRSSLRR